jgi:sporulation related protein
MSDASDSPKPPPPPPPPPQGPGAGAGKPPPPPPPRGPSDRSTQARTAIPPPPPPAAAARPPTCPNCGVETAAGQQVCIECGHDLTRAYERAPGWRLWVVAGVIGVLAVGVGAGFAIGALTNDKQKKKAARATATTATIPNLAGPVPPLTNTPPVTPTAPAPVPPTTPTAPAPGETPTAPTTPTTPTAPTTPSTPAPSGGAPASWPAGKTAYTVVLISAKKKAQANAKAKEAKTRGIDAGVLRSDDYSSLNPGYWVVFAGQYKTADQARSHIDEFAGKGFPGGYPRLVKK